jgi:hypothetical protein
MLNDPQAFQKFQDAQSGLGCSNPVLDRGPNAHFDRIIWMDVTKGRA